MYVFDWYFGVPQLAAGVLLWILCGIVAAVAAESKRRSYGRWLLLGVIFGPLAVLVIARLGEYIAPAEARPCPKCGRTIRLSTTRCPKCKEWVAVDGSVDRAAQAGYVAGRLFQRFRRAQSVARRQLRREESKR